MESETGCRGRRLCSALFITWCRYRDGGHYFFLTMALLTIIFLDANPAALITFLVFTVLYLLGYFAFLFWTIVVCENRGILVYYRPPFQPVRVRISEITTVQFLERHPGRMEWNKIRVYRHEKRLFEVDDMMDGFERIADYLFMMQESRVLEADRCDYGVCESYTSEWGYLKRKGVETAEAKDDFSVTETTSERALYGGSMAFWFIMVILLAFDWREWIWDKEFYIYCVVLLLFAVGSMAGFISKMLYKISVSNQKIRVRNGFGRVREYAVQEIAAIEEKEQYIVLYAGEKKIAKISRKCVNYASFEEWLIRELENEEQERWETEHVTDREWLYDRSQVGPGGQL